MGNSLILFFKTLFSIDDLYIWIFSRFENKSLFYSVKDKKIFEGKIVSIFGGGDSALDWAVELSKNSKVNLVIVNEEKDILKYVKQNIFGDKIVIGMGAGSISNWMRSLEHKLKWNYKI